MTQAAKTTGKELFWDLWPVLEEGTYVIYSSGYNCVIPKIAKILQDKKKSVVIGYSKNNHPIYISKTSLYGNFESFAEAELEVQKVSLIHQKYLTDLEDMNLQLREFRVAIMVKESEGKDIIFSYLRNLSFRYTRIY